MSTSFDFFLRVHSRHVVIQSSNSLAAQLKLKNTTQNITRNNKELTISCILFLKEKIHWYNFICQCLNTRKKLGEAPANFPAIHRSPEVCILFVHGVCGSLPCLPQFIVVLAKTPCTLIPYNNCIKWRSAVVIPVVFTSREK